MEILVVILFPFVVTGLGLLSSYILHRFIERHVNNQKGGKPNGSL